MVNEEMYRVAWKRKHDINERALFAYIQTKLGVETKEYLSSLEGRDVRTFHITSRFSDAWIMAIFLSSFAAFNRMASASACCCSSKIF